MNVACLLVACSCRHLFILQCDFIKNHSLGFRCVEPCAILGQATCGGEGHAVEDLLLVQVAGEGIVSRLDGRGRMSIGVVVPSRPAVLVYLYRFACSLGR